MTTFLILHVDACGGKVKKKINKKKKINVKNVVLTRSQKCPWKISCPRLVILIRILIPRLF